MPRWPWRRRDGGDAGLPGGRGVPPAPDQGSRADGGTAPPDLVEISVGFDRFAAGALVARLEAEGVPVRLLTMDDHGLVVGLAALQPHRLLIRASDEEQVRALIERTR